MAIQNLCSGIVLLLFCIIGYYSTSKIVSEDQFIYGPSFYPNALMVILGVGALILISQGLYAIFMTNSFPKKSAQYPQNYVLKILLFWATIAMYIVVFHLTGFIIASFIYLITAQILFGRRRFFHVALVSALGTGLTYFVLVILFEVPLPSIFNG